MKMVDIRILFDECAVYAKVRDYAGYSKFDAFNSAFLKKITPNNKWARLIVSQVIMRSPINLRPLFGVKKERNPKGIALFAKAYLLAYQATDDEKYLYEAQELLSWLKEHHTKGYSGMAWGYNFDWQDIGFFAPKYMPNCIVTCFVLDSFCLAYEVTKDKKYLDVIMSGAEFILHDLKKLYDEKDMLCISYAPVEMNMVVMDTSAWAARICAKLYSYTKKKIYRESSFRLINYVVDKQTDYGAWFYSHPPKESHITHDNYHTGYILDCIIDYMRYVGDKRYTKQYKKGCSYYVSHLFKKNGAPKFMNDKTYPFDIHGSAQGIITFCLNGNPLYKRMAAKIFYWTMKNLYNKQGYFYYQKTRFFTKTFLLMRWNQAWMCNAIAHLLRYNAL